jgi:hypothetical protein
LHLFFLNIAFPPNEMLLENRIEQIINDHIAGKRNNVKQIRKADKKARNRGMKRNHVDGIKIIKQAVIYKFIV